MLWPFGCGPGNVLQLGLARVLEFSLIKTVKVSMTPQSFGKTRFLALISAALVGGGLAPSAQAASVGPGGYTNSFNTQPVAADWSTYAPPGVNTTWGTVADLDA